MTRYWMFRKGRFLIFFVAALAVFGLVVMGLWNWLMPAVFGWNEIGFLQAVGLVVLSRILFGRFPGFWGHGGHWRHRMRERWERMTPEEREKFRSGFRGHCGFHGDAEATEPQASGG